MYWGYREHNTCTGAIGNIIHVLGLEISSIDDQSPLSDDNQQFSGSN